MKVKFFGVTNQGLVRENNEDSLISQLVWDEFHLLCVVIDGVGGYEGGEIASETARSTILQYIIDNRSSDQLDLIKHAVLNANEEIIKKKNDPKYSRMGCVITASLIDLQEKCIYIAHVGDTRLYQYVNDKLEKLTHDHSLVGYREEIGDLTEEEAMSHPNRSLLDRYVGDVNHEMEDEDFIEASIYPIIPNSQLLLCTDGLFDMATNQEIREVLAKEDEVEEKCHQLVNLANRKGGIDNVTVIVVEFNSEDEDKPPYSVYDSNKLVLLAFLFCITLFVGYLIGSKWGMSKEKQELIDSIKIKNGIIDEYRYQILPQNISLSNDSTYFTDSLANKNNATVDE